MTDYDSVAAGYDEHYRRPVDRWEDERLVDLLGPLVDGRDVLDLGCGTGWVLDHLHPNGYCGIDASAGMLAVAAAKHPDRHFVKQAVGASGWMSAVPVSDPEVVVSTWAAHEFPLVETLRALVALGPRTIALHGSGPRYVTRSHYVAAALDTEHPYTRYEPRQIAAAASLVGLGPPSTVRGTGALPDRLTGLGHTAWRVALAAPARLHYAALYVWRLR